MVQTARNFTAETRRRGEPKRSANSELQNLFPKRRDAQLHRQVGGLVVLVDDWVDFHDLEAGHAPVVGDDLHGQVGFAVGGAAAYRRAYAGSVFRIDPIHVERDVVAGGAAAGHAQRLFDDGAHAALIDIAHGEDFDAGAKNIFFFGGIHVADTDQHA